MLTKPIMVKTKILYIFLDKILSTHSKRDIKNALAVKNKAYPLSLFEPERLMARY